MLEINKLSEKEINWRLEAIYCPTIQKETILFTNSFAAIEMYCLPWLKENDVFEVFIDDIKATSQLSSYEPKALATLLLIFAHTHKRILPCKKKKLNN